MSSSSCSVAARSTPAWRNSASTTASRPASAAVCEAAARAPARLGRSAWPGSASSAQRVLRSRANLRGLPNDSRYSSTTSVSGSSSQYSSRSFDETSALLPIDTNADSPRPRASACSSSARPSAPLCDENATRPGGNARRRERRVEARRRSTRCRGSSARSGARRGRGRARAAPPGARRRRCPSPRTRPRRRTAPASRAQRRVARHRSPARPGRRSRPGRPARGSPRPKWYARIPPTGAPARLTGYAVPSKSAGDHVAEQLAADRAAPRGGTDHGDRTRAEEAPATRRRPSDRGRSVRSSTSADAVSSNSTSTTPST